MAPPRNRSRARPACGITRRPSRQSMKAGASPSRNLSWAPRPARRRCCTRAAAFWAGGSSPQSDLVLAAFHWLEYLGLLGGVGSFVVRRLGRIPPRIAWADPPMHIAFATAVAGGLGLLAFQPSWWGVPRVVAEGTALVLCLRGAPFGAPPAGLAAALLALARHADGARGAAGGAHHGFSAGAWAGGGLPPL